MTDAYTPEGGEGTDAAPETGDMPAEVTQETEAEAPSRQYVEVDDPDNRYVRTKVQGEDVEVPFSEALRGYSREADYTRKAQEVAEQRREAEYGMRLQRALEANPGTTLRILAEQYGFNLAEAQQALDTAKPAEPEFADPLEQGLHEERQARMALEQRLQQREADEQLRYALGDLRSRYQLSDDDLQNVVATAYQQNLPVQALPMIAESFAFQRIQARILAARDEETKRQETEAQRQQAAAAANGVVTSQTGAGQGALVDRLQSDGTMSLREAIEAAFDAAGVE